MCLQGTAAFACITNQIGQALDIKTESGLFWIWWTTVANAGTIFVTRGYQFPMIAYNLFMIFYNDKRHNFLAGGSVGCLLMEVFNLLHVDRVRIIS